MANEVSTRFSNVGIPEMVRDIDRLLNKINSIPDDKTFGLKIVDQSKAIQDSLNLENKRLQVGIQSERLTKASLQTDAEKIKNVNLLVKAESEVYRQIVAQERAEKAAIQTDRERLKLKKDALDIQSKQVRLEEQKSRSFKGEFGSEVGSRLGLPIPTSPAAAAATVVFAAGYGGKKILDQGAELQSAQKLLQASAKETGVIYDDLNKKAQKFADINRLSETAANDNFARITSFAGAAGRLDKVDQFSQAFSDLASAKGIKSTELGEVAKQLNALTDEATDKLLGANPSAFYDKFAQSIGTTADKLDDAQKRAAVFDEVIRRGAIFSGEAEKKANTYAGVLEKMGAAWDNFVARLGKDNGPVVAEALKFLFSATTGSPDFFIEPPTNADKQAEANRKYRNELPDLQKQQQEFLDAKQNPRANFRNYALSRLELNRDVFVPDALDSQKQVEDKLLKFRAERQNSFNINEYDPAVLKQTTDKAVEYATKESAELVKRFKDIASKRPPLAVLLFEQEQFKQNSFRLIDQKAKDEVSDALGNAIDEVVKSGFQKGLGKSAENYQQFQKIVKDIAKSPLLKSESKEELFDTADRIQKQFDKIKDEFKDLAISSFAATSANPFVKLFGDADKAIDQTYEKFKVFGNKFARQAADVARRAEQVKVNLAFFESRQREFGLRREAANLGRLVDADINGVGRRTSLLEQSLGSLSQSVNYRLGALDARALAGGQFTTTRGFEEPLKVLQVIELQQKLGTNLTYRDRLETNLALLQFRAQKEQQSIAESKDILEPLKNLEIAMKSLFRRDGEYLGRTIPGLYPSDRFSDLGIYGQEKVAQAKLSLLPSVDELLNIIRSGGPQSDQARQALNFRADYQETLAQASDQRLKDSLQKDDYLRGSLADIQKQINQTLGDRTVPAVTRLDTAANLYKEIGTENLSRDQLRDFQNVLTQRANIEAQQRDQINKVMEKIYNLLGGDKGGGAIPVRFGNKPIIDLTIKEGRFSVQTGTRPGDGDVISTR